MNNPQYKIVVQPPPSGVPLDTLGDLDLICATQKDIAINVKILRKGGERVSESVLCFCVRIQTTDISCLDSRKEI